MGNSRARRKLRRLLREQGLSVPQPSPAKAQTKLTIPFWKRIPKWFYATLSVLAIAITVLQAYPWLSIQRSGVFLNPKNPYSEMFDVKNGGYIPVTDLTADCMMDFTDMYGNGMHGSPMSGPVFADYLGDDGQVTIPCFRMLTIDALEPSSTAALSVRINYAMYHLNIPVLRRHQDFRFRSVAGKDGSQHWEFLP
jgi:hypothetical protein